MSSTNRKTAARQLARKANIPYQTALKAVISGEATPPSPAPVWWHARMEPLCTPDHSFHLYHEDEFPMGRDAAGKEIVINVAETPHAIVVGPTGSGRSIPVRSMLLRALASTTWTVCLIDLRRTEFDGVREHPSVLSLASDLPHAIEVLRACGEEIQHRHDSLRAESVSYFQDLANPPKRLLVIIDEAYPLFASAPSATEDVTMETRSLIKSIARLGHAAGVYLVMASARPWSELASAMDMAPFFDTRIVMGDVDAPTVASLLSEDCRTTVLSVRGGALMQRTGRRGPQLDSLGVYWIPDPNH